jgi:hypothetical protein
MTRCLARPSNSRTLTCPLSSKWHAQSRYYTVEILTIMADKWSGLANIMVQGSIFFEVVDVE